VRGGRAAVEQAGGGEDVDAGADGGDPGAGADAGERGGQFVGQHTLVEDRAELVRRRDDHGVGGGQRLRAVSDVDGEVGVGLDRARRPDRAGDDLVEMPPLGVLRAPEDPVRDAQLEREQPVEGEDDDAVRAELRVTRVAFRLTHVHDVPAHAHGPILTNAVLRANGSDGAQARSSLS
jgi:hypothetical protein